ncbi:alpha,alpha-trehalose-phosphate synthase (UDP-forming) [soil metagenome]
MDVVSYRGPGAAGGVSSGLETAWRGQQTAEVSWWFLGEDALKFLTPSKIHSEFVTQLNDPVVKGHYAYCNEFIWPLMHDLPEYASYNPENRKHYKRFNTTFAQYINFERATKKRYFVQDYQLALLPRLLGLQGGRSNIFWHIPWPKNVNEEHVEAISDIARGMLSAESIGFHTNEYAQNFLAFVRQNLSEFSINAKDQMIYKTQTGMAHREMEMASGGELSPYVMRSFMHSVAAISASTKLVVQPLGIDNERWNELAKTGTAPLDRVGVKPGEKFVLSVDRADYTKAVLDRLKIIDLLMEQNESLRGQVSFVQICGRSRAGVEVFDKYWDDCRSLAESINERWQKDGWTPIRWVEQGLSAAELAPLYAVADVMLVNPVRDGLNLTAKEFVACRSGDPGVLLLSPGAGAWHEIGQHALAADPTQHQATADAIVRALSMSREEKFERTLMMRRKIELNPLTMWWKQFVHASSQPHKVAETLQTAKTA